MRVRVWRGEGGCEGMRGEVLKKVEHEVRVSVWRGEGVKG